MAGKGPIVAGRVLGMALDKALSKGALIDLAVTLAKSLGASKEDDVAVVVLQAHITSVSLSRKDRPISLAAEVEKVRGYEALRQAVQSPKGKQ